MLASSFLFSSCGTAVYDIDQCLRHLLNFYKSIEEERLEVYCVITALYRLLSQDLSILQSTYISSL